MITSLSVFRNLLSSLYTYPTLTYIQLLYPVRIIVLICGDETKNMKIRVKKVIELVVELDQREICVECVTR